MPQFETVTFLSQLFWLTIFFVTFYLITLRYTLPALSATLKIRKKYINSYVEALGQLDAETSSASSDYEDVLVKAFANSKDVLAERNTFSLNVYESNVQSTFFVYSSELIKTSLVESYTLLNEVRTNISNESTNMTKLWSNS